MSAGNVVQRVVCRGTERGVHSNITDSTEPIERSGRAKEHGRTVVEVAGIQFGGRDKERGSTGGEIGGRAIQFGGRAKERGRLVMEVGGWAIQFGVPTNLRWVTAYCRMALEKVFGGMAI